MVSTRSWTTSCAAISTTVEKLVELTKDLGAFQVYGGYIVIGVDDKGSPTGDLTDDEAALFDEAVLRSKVERYLTGFDIRTKGFVLDGKNLILICVRPHPDGWAVFVRDGSYAGQGERQEFAFRAGEVYARHGSKSERWDQDDATRIRNEIRSQEREAAKLELRDEFAGLVAQGGAAQTAARGPVGTLSIDLDLETLTNAAIELVRASDDIPLILLFKQAPARALELALAGEPEFDAVLDRLICLGAVFSTVERSEPVRRAIDSLGAIYNSTFDNQGLDRRDLRIDPADLRFRIVTRAFALGALLTRNKQWSDIRYISDVRVASHDADYWQNWLFHGDVMAARAGFHQDEEGEGGRESYKSTLVFAQEHIARLPDLRPDVSPEDELVVTSLCQFSLLTSFVALSTPEGKSTGSFLAHFGRWFAGRTDPMVVALIDGGEIREEIYPHDDQSLSNAIRSVGANARAMSHLLHGWHGYEDPRIIEFLNTHPEAE